MWLRATMVLCHRTWRQSLEGNKISPLGSETIIKVIFSVKEDRLLLRMAPAKWHIKDRGVWTGRARIQKQNLCSRDEETICVYLPVMTRGARMARDSHECSMKDSDALWDKLHFCFQLIRSVRLFNSLWSLFSTASLQPMTGWLSVCLTDRPTGTDPDWLSHPSLFDFLSVKLMKYCFCLNSRKSIVWATRRMTGRHVMTH